jgi:hypothetical protein
MTHPNRDQYPRGIQAKVIERNPFDFPWTFNNTPQDNEQGESMSAKHKLNAACIIGSAIIAGLLGVLSQSFFVFIVAASIIIAVEVYSGSIRVN